jgi:hypothetical protein
MRLTRIPFLWLTCSFLAAVFDVNVVGKRFLFFLLSLKIPVRQKAVQMK